MVSDGSTDTAVGNTDGSQTNSPFTACTSLYRSTTLVAGRDLTWIDSLQAYTCVECGRCTEHCPAQNTGKLLDPKEIILGARRYLNECGPASETPLLGEHL